jgi:heme/copper-type cytochrome/quinol oxidase subunit 2
MNGDLLTILIVLSLGIFLGTVIGLSVFYLAGYRQREWQAMTGGEKITGATLALGCSALCCAGLAWYAFR